MTEAAIDSFERHEGFTTTESGFDVASAAFQASVAVTAEGVRVTVVAPTLSAAVRDGDVAPVLEDGWFETFERRLRGVGSALRTDVAGVAVERDGSSVVVTVDLAEPGSRAAEEAQAAANFVETTWLQGVVPGYEYEEPVATLRRRARERGETG